MQDERHIPPTQRSGYEAPNKYQSVILGALQGEQIYAGTADPIKVANRRAKNKARRATKRRQRIARKGK